MTKAIELFTRRQRRVRVSLSRKAWGRPRLSVFRSGKHIYAQIIDDQNGKTLTASSSLEKELRSALKNGGNKAAAEAVGKLLAQRAVKAGIDKVVFDRGGYMFHGRVKALADAAREGGLSF